MKLNKLEPTVRAVWGPGGHRGWQDNHLVQMEPGVALLPKAGDQSGPAVLPPLKFFPWPQIGFVIHADPITSPLLAI